MHHCISSLGKVGGGVDWTRAIAMAVVVFVLHLAVEPCHARPGDIPAAKSKEERSPNVSNAIRLVTVPASSRLNRDDYWQLYLEPSLDYDIASAAERQAIWERLLSTLWSKSEAASVTLQLVLAPGTVGSPTPERPVVLMSRKNGVVDESIKVRPGPVTGYFRAVPDPKARVDISLGYSERVDQSVLSTALKLIDAVGPTLSLPAKWVSVASSRANQTLASRADVKLSELLSSSTPAVASKEFDITSGDSIEIRTLSDPPTVLARISIRARTTLLAADLQSIPIDDPFVLMRSRWPSSEASSTQKTAREAMEAVVGGRATDTGAQFDASCKLIDERLQEEAYNSVDRALLLAVWLVDRGYNSAATSRTGTPRGCEARVARLKNTSAAGLIQSKDQILLGQVNQSSQLTRQQFAAAQTRYATFASVLRSSNPEDLVAISDFTVKVRTDIDRPVFNDLLGIKSADVASTEIDTVELARVLKDQIAFVSDLAKNGCFTLISNATPNVVRCRCLTAPGEPLVALLTLSAPVWDVSAKIIEVRFQRPGMAR